MSPTLSMRFIDFFDVGKFMYKKEKAEILKNNVKYLIKSRGETQISIRAD